MKTVIFDLDGTLMNTIETITYYCNKALREYGFTEATEDEYKYFVGNGAKVLIERALSKSGEYTGEDFNNVFTYYNKIYDNEPLYLTRPYDNVVEVLDELSKLGIKTAILSNKPDVAAREVVDKLIGKGKVTICRGAIDEFPLKPDPSSAIDIMEKLGADKNETFFVGDTYVDITTGKNAGVKTIGVKWGFRTEEELKKAGADYIIDNAFEILDIVK